jgi:hypothetical protein
MFTSHAPACFQCMLTKAPTNTCGQAASNRADTRYLVALAQLTTLEHVYSGDATRQSDTTLLTVFSIAVR